jgi:hypothetical protein
MTIIRATVVYGRDGGRWNRGRQQSPTYHEFPWDKADTATLIHLLNTQRQQISAEQKLSQAKTTLIADFVGIQKALNLGWTG